jgi:hypothetical protein
MEQEGRNKSPGSEALQIFQTNSDNVMYLLRVISGDSERLKDLTDAANRLTADTVAALADTIGAFRNLKKGSPNFTLELAQGSSNLDAFSSNLDALKKNIDKVCATLQANVKTHPFLYDWVLVMMVTFAEAYLENALLLLITAYPEWMKTKDPVKLSGADVLAIEATPDTEKRWQELMALLRKRWVKQFLRDSPRDWIKRLRKRGVLGYREDLAEKMETVWDRRHVIVHAPPAAQSAQVTGLSGPTVATLVQSLTEFSDATSVIDSFVHTTDAFVVTLLNSFTLQNSALSRKVTE